MAQYKYLQLALRGEKQGLTQTLYSYQPEGTDIDPAWATTMVEPGAAIKRFLNADECYVLQRSPKGYYISLIARDSERGVYMISMLVDDGCALTGRTVLSIFSALRKAWIQEGNLTDEATETALLEAGVPLEPVCLEAWTYVAPESSVTLEEAAYRTYISVQELESIFSFPGQPDYESYRCVLVVSATTSLRPGVKMPRITVPIRKQYDVICPEGVTASASLLYDGERLTLTYTKEGFDSHTESFIAGNPSADAKYDGSTIRIRTSVQTGMRFVRRVPVKVTSSKGGALNGYTISVNGSSVSTAEPYIEFTEKDLEPGTDVEIQVASNNYSPLRLKYPAEEMLTMEELPLELQPVEQTVTLRLDFGEGRVLEQVITIEKNTPEYNRLHSGNFHGFRANRQVNDDHTEVYNVDVRLSCLPEAPNFAAARGEGSDSRMKAPRFVNISDDTADDAAERPVFDPTLPGKEMAGDEETGDTDDEATAGSTYRDYGASRQSSTRRRKMMIWSVVAVVVLTGIVLAALFIPRGEALDATPAAVTEMTSEGDGSPASAPVAPMTPEEQADADYLNGSPAWDLSKLASPMGLGLAEAMRNGDLEALANNDYFTVNGRCTNSKALQMVDLAWRAIGSPNENSNRARLRKGSSIEGSISLYDLVNSMAKVRPAEHANERPRPRR